jgi:AcrR family transcriptional regulator
MVASTSNTIQPFGEEDSSKRRQILDGAGKVFMDLGFDGASMNEIARAAGVSKGTLYVYFTDKSRLFEAIVEDEALEKAKIAYNLDPGRDVETTLQGLAVLRALGVADDAEHVNPNGGAIALGHPLGASGARLVGTAALEMRRRNARYGLCTMCIGVGQGIALALESAGQ